MKKLLVAALVVSSLSANAWESIFTPPNTGYESNYSTGNSMMQQQMRDQQNYQRQQDLQQQFIQQQQQVQQQQMLQQMQQNQQMQNQMQQQIQQQNLFNRY